MPSHLLSCPLSAEMGPRVLGLLRTLTPLPDRGIVAGQAVTSALLELYGDGARKGPFNDVDVFIANERFRRPLNMAFQVDVRTFSRTPLAAMRNEHEPDNEYTQVSLPGMTSRPAFTISRVRGEGLLNTIDVNPQSVKRGKGKPGIDLGLDSTDVVSSFDLNCVEAAVDLETGQLSWTRSFAWFMKTGQIQVSNVHGEPHTLVRILKKLDEMPWAHCDLETTGQALMFTLGVKRMIQDSLMPLDGVQKFMDTAAAAATVSNAAQRREQARQPVPLILPTLGPVYMKRYARHASTLERWFALEERPLISRGASMTVPVSRISPIDLGAAAGLDLSVRFLKSLYSSSDAPGRSRLSKTSREKLQSALPFLMHDTIRRSYRQGLVHGKAVEDKREILARAAEHGYAVYTRRREDAMQREAAAHLEKFEAGQASTPELDPAVLDIRADLRMGKFHPLTLQSQALQGISYLDGQVNQNAAQAVDAFAHQHEGLAAILLGLPLQQQVEAIKIVKRLDAEFDGVAIGLIETNEHAFTGLGLLDESALRARLEVLKTELSKPIDIKPMPVVEPMPSSAGAPAIRVQQILSPVDLMLEGHRMHHCVGGYVFKMERGDSRIFRLTSGRSVLEASTLELGLDFCNGLPSFTRAQHTGFANGATPPGHRDAARHLIGRLNALLYKDCQFAPPLEPIVLQDMVVEGRRARAELIANDSSALIDSLCRGVPPKSFDRGQQLQTLNTIFDAGPVAVPRTWATKFSVDGLSKDMIFEASFNSKGHPQLVEAWIFNHGVEVLPESDLAYGEVLKALYRAAVIQASMITLTREERNGFSAARKRNRFGMTLEAA